MPRIFLLTSMILSSFPALSQAKFVPAIILSHSGNVDEQTKAEVTEKITRMVRTIAISEYSREIYGRGEKFNKSKAGPSPLGVLAKVFRSVDQRLEEMVQTELQDNLAKIPQGQSIGISLEALWIKAPHAFPSMMKEARAVSSSFGMVWNLAEMVLKERSQSVKHYTTMFAESADIPVLDSSEVPGGLQSLYNMGKSAYYWLAESNQEAYRVLYIDLSIKLNPSMVVVRFSSVLKPAAFSMKLEKPEPEDYTVGEELTHSPAFFSAKPPVARVIYGRTYGVRQRGSVPPHLKLAFGNLYGDDVRTLAYCKNECAATDRRVGPIHLKRIAPTVPLKFRVPDTMKKVARSAFGLFVPKINKKLDMYVLFNELYFDLANPENPTVVADKSKIPMVIKLTSSKGEHSYIDITKNRFGFNFMEHLVASKASEEMTFSIKDSLIKADSGINKKFAAIVNRFNQKLQ